MDLLRNIGLVRQFLAVAREGNVTVAAETLGISQPALTKSIRRLEAECGVPLFDRHKRGVSLTLYGKALLRHAKLIDSECRFASSELEALREGHRGQLKIGGGPFWGATLLPAAVAEVGRRFPDLRIKLTIGVNPVIHPMLFDGELDLTVSAAPHDIEALPPHVAFKEINRIHHRTFARHDHPLFAKPEVDMRELSRFPWVVYQHDLDVIQRVSASLAALGAGPPKVAVEASSLVAVLQLVRFGDFLTCLAAPLFHVFQGFGIRPLPVDVPTWSFPAGILYHRAVETFAPVKVLAATLASDAARLEAGEHPLLHEGDLGEAPLQAEQRSP
jgi:DNA-binding transcriptional LysR family regulator